MKRLLSILTFVVCAAIAACKPAALEDTPANRLAQAERYMQTMPPEILMKEMINKMAEQLPADQRDRFIELMTKQIDMAKVRSVMRDAMVKDFTAEELRALADFYGSPLGKSAMAKFGAYTAETLPIIQREVRAAYLNIQVTAQTPAVPASTPPASTPPASTPE